MSELSERSAYPHPDDFKVMRPEYVELEDETAQASITIAPFRVVGKSVSRPGARRAALYEAEKTYRSYHPSYRVGSPYPDRFVDDSGTTWERTKPSQRHNGDYKFTDEEGDDYADIESMLMWDVRIQEVL
ncbi:MAG: hypothetical protein AAGI08_08290 [Bacteroidota bacterium]